MSYIPPTVDNTQLYSGTLSSAGSIAGIDTSGYASVILQVSGVWAGNLWIEGSNDNAIWQELMPMSANEFSAQDVILENGVYSLKTTTKYIRLNVLQLQSGTITCLAFGRTTIGISGSDMLSYAMDKQSNLPLYVSEVNAKKDITQALIPSDAPAPIWGSSSTINSVVFMIDTTGYQSIVIQSFSLGGFISVQSSNDGNVWVNLYGVNGTLSTVPVFSITLANSVYEFPANGKFVRGLSTGAGFSNVLVYLRQRPFNSFTSAGTPVNISFVGGTAAPPVTGNVSNNTISNLAGILSVGATYGPGNTIVPYPIIVGGREAASDGALAGKVRTFLLDTLGKAIITGDIQAGASSQGIKSIAVQDTALVDGQSQIEILSQILLELKISNQYMYDLPMTLQRLLHDTSKNPGVFGNEPQEFRNESSIFNN